MQEHHHDAYVLKAREQGYRSRAVFKLEQIQQKDHILKPGQFVLDLGAAPGSWSEYASNIVGDRGRVIALDLLPIEPIAGVEVVQGDFTEQRTLDRSQTGKLVNKNWHDYKLATALDVPADMVCVPIDRPDPEANTTGAKGIGEPATIPTAAAIANAIYHATGVRITDTPIDPSKLVVALAAAREGE